MNEKHYYPMLAVDTTAQHRESTVDRWAIFDTLPQRAQDILTAPQMVELIKALTHNWQQRDTKVAQFSTLVRHLLFNEIDQDSFIQQASQTFAVEPNTAALFLEHLFALNPAAQPSQESDLNIDYESAPAAQIAKHITAQAMMNDTAKSKILRRLKSPHFANELLSCVAVDHYEKLGFVHSLYTQANERTR